MSHVQDRIEMARSLRKQVCRLLQWDELQYAEFQYKCGCQYLQHYIPNDPCGIDELLQHRMYWNWWKNQWQNRDYAYLIDTEKQLEQLSVKNRELLYIHFHDATVLAQEISPNGIILANAYKIMMGKLIKAEVI